ncbi:MAG: hypothetical protein MI807_02690 [Verrucomicrobiales bacterium]|nr:hypothetical protein [Verrucomicrobiales bacterium]
MDNEPADETDSASHLARDDGEDRIVAALDHLREVLRGSGESYWEANTSRQKSCLQEWAEGLDLRLDPDQILPRLKRGGQEHDYFLEEEMGQCIKLTRSGVFGLTPGIDLALVPSDQDARRFHLWEASPYQYLERLRLQNLITPDLNRLEGIVVQEDDLAICISQPRLELISVTQEQIDDWFVSLGFEIVTSAAYYRRDDNLGVFDAHDKNVVRASADSDILVPFDVIPVQPDGGFLEFIHSTLEAGGSLQVIRTAHTTTRALT